MATEKILDLGCGNRKHDGALGLDRVPLPNVDVVHDLEKFPYPFSDSSFDRIILKHVIEHVDNVIGLMEEIHRLGRPGAIVEIHTPHFTSSNSYNDPTHRHHFSLLTFDFFCGGTEHGYVHNAKFRLVDRQMEFWPLHDKLPFVPYHFFGVRRFARAHPVLFERFFCFLFPVKEFSVFLSVVKN